MKTKMLTLALLAVLTAAVPTVASEDGSLQGDPFRGRDLLSEKLCTECHSVWGHGGELGPDISVAVAGKSLLDLVGDFWNHTPRMIDAMAERGHTWPTLEKSEMADLLSYLYYLRLFDAPGDPVRGAIAFSQLRCASCHTLGGKGGSGGGALDEFSAYPSPVMLAQAMWNSGPGMQRDQLRRGTPIPMFSGDEMADIQTYIRAHGLRTDRKVKLLSLPDPAAGGKVFGEKGCSACHPAGGGDGPDLDAANLDRSVSELSSILWNHSYAMNDRMQARGLRFPRFADTEMADLISYLFFRGFVREEGDSQRGRTVYRSRGCASCHEAPGGAAVDLSQSRAAGDPIALSAAMWNHAPDMHRLMAEQAVAWPKLDPGDMRDLAAFLQADR